MPPATDRHGFSLVFDKDGRAAAGSSDLVVDTAELPRDSLMKACQFKTPQELENALGRLEVLRFIDRLKGTRIQLVKEPD